jgi:hypothetical protein
MAPKIAEAEADARALFMKNASDIETKVLEWLRMEVGLPFQLTSKQMPQGGHTETVAASEIELATVWAKVEELSRAKK